MSEDRDRQLIGWREWLSLPELGIVRIKAKIDSGARTSALHAFRVEAFRQGGQPRVHFSLHPLQRSARVVECEADVIDERWVTDSGGRRERRFVIQTPVQVGVRCWPIELTLTDRESMLFRMLLGRTAMMDRLIVDPAASYLLGRPPRKPRPDPA